MFIEVASIEFHDEESNSVAFVSIRKYEKKVAFSLSLKENGDLDTLMGQETAKAIADALYTAIGENPKKRKTTVSKIHRAR
ncbi:MAG: hypothetical protein PVG39_08735 [Desulfobacteraceae bacterium]|jgi:hypothetical protein